VFTYVSLKFSRLHQEGFPIENITGSVSLENGVVSTGDLLMDSGIAKISLEGLIDLRSRKVDMNIFFQALQFIPDLISRVPGLGMLLVGEKKQLLPLIVKVEGDLKNPKVKPLPFDTITKPVFDTMKRVLNLPLKSFKFLFGK
ncbi:MAG TPA: AsmA-like C-terminal domain-containing protein, partial [bacterium]|nr:AsmA-like C-terminal domain-containing protein [bacterium]